MLTSSITTLLKASFQNNITQDWSVSMAALNNKYCLARIRTPSHRHEAHDEICLNPAIFVLRESLIKHNTFAVVIVVDYVVLAIYVTKPEFSAHLSN